MVPDAFRLPFSFPNALGEREITSYPVAGAGKGGRNGIVAGFTLDIFLWEYKSVQCLYRRGLLFVGRLLYGYPGSVDKQETVCLPGIAL